MPIPSGAFPALPRSLTSLIGREREIDEVTVLLSQDDVRLLTLTGSGGVGKTRLALAAAERMRSAYADRVVMVLLASISDHTLVIPAIAAAIHSSETPGMTPLERLAATIGEDRLLLILDNLEHLLDAATDFSEMLARCPNLTILATSRTPLHLYGEQQYPVSTLSVPTEAARLSGDDLLDSPAMTLFIERLRASQPGFEMTPANAAAIAGICRRLDGLPLAIELAAARCNVFPPVTLLARLEQSLTLLTGGPRDAPDRQQTLRDTIAWSYNLLDVSEQALFRRLAVFAGGFTLAAAEAVCTGWNDEHVDIMDGLTSLTDKNLIVPQDPATDEFEDMPRFGMLETIREFGLEQLDRYAEAVEARRRHARYLLTWAERSTEEWYTPRQLVWLRRGDTDLDNLRAALGWAVEHDAEIALRLNTSIGGYWLYRGFFSEGRRWFEIGLERSTNLSDTTRMTTLFNLSFLAITQTDFAAGQDLTEQNLAVAYRLNDQRGIGLALHNLGRIAMYEGDLEQADALFQQSVQAARDLEDDIWLVNALGNLGAIVTNRGDHERAAVYLDEALLLSRETGDLGAIAIYTNDRAYLALQSGQFDLARTLLKESLTALQSLADPRATAQTLETCARLAAFDHQPTASPVLLGATDRIRKSIGVPVAPSGQSYYSQYVPALKERLGPVTWDAGWSEGSAMTLHEVVEYALAILDQSDLLSSRTAPRSGDLSNREVDVLRLIVDGLTNQEIAGMLFISQHTVANHVASILNKLGLESRTAAAAYAVRHGMI